MRTFFKYAQHLSEEQRSEAIDLLTRLRNLLVGSASPLSPDEKKNRGMAEKREGYVRLVLRVASNFAEELPRSFDLEECNNLLQAREDWKTLLLKAEEAAELAEDTEYAIGVELMKQIDRAANSLNAGRKNNPALDRAMREIDDYNQQFGAKKKEVDYEEPDDIAGKVEEDI
jgi:hypothetical protein